MCFKESPVLTPPYLCICILTEPFAVLHLWQQICLLIPATMLITNLGKNNFFWELFLTQLCLRRWREKQEIPYVLLGPNQVPDKTWFKYRQKILDVPC